MAPLYSSALTNFLTRRNSPLTAPMFLSLFTRHPVSGGAALPQVPAGPALTTRPLAPSQVLSKDLLPVIIRHLTGPLRPRQQVRRLLGAAQGVLGVLWGPDPLQPLGLTLALSGRHLLRAL